MTLWWESLTVLQQVFYYIAAPFTVILLIQTVMTLIGLGNIGVDADSDGDFDADVDTDFDADIEADFDADMEADFDVEGDVDAESFEPSSAVSGFRFFTVRGIPEVSGAMFGIDLLIMLPAVAWLGAFDRFQARALGRAR